MSVSLATKHGVCRSCNVDQHPVLHRVIGQNGGQHFTWVCCRCNQQGCFSTSKKDSPPFYISATLIQSHLTPKQIEALPVIMPDASNRCVVCGERKAERHHWAPKEIFGADEAERWPKDYLCVPCHLKWHDTINSFRSK